MKRKILLGMCLCFFAGTSISYGAEQVARENLFKMEEVLVTGTIGDEKIADIPKSVTVITADDIKKAPSNNIVDLLSREAGVIIRSQMGHDKWSGVDIRGMGEASGSSVIVLIDGVRINAVDLSFPDLSIVPIDSIERIEIIRGAGSVVYGDGAVGGVINIITKKGNVAPELKISTSFGSYNTTDTRISGRGRVDRLFFNMNADYYGSDGYRDNNYLRKKDFGLTFGADVTDWLTLSVQGAFHEDDYGLPGSLSWDEAKNSDSRKLSHSMFDYGNTADNRLKGMMDFDLGDYGTLKLLVGNRDRKNDYIVGYISGMSDQSQMSLLREDTNHGEAVYDLDFEAFGLSHSFSIGTDFQDTDYTTEYRAWGSKTDNNVKRYGVFALARLGITDSTDLRGGYRKSRLEYDSTSMSSYGSSRLEDKWNNNAWEVGLVQRVGDSFRLFANVSSSFRTPNVDELAYQPGDLKPQTGTHYDLGFRYKMRDRLEFSMTLFYAKIEDEIYYDPNVNYGYGYNLNYDDNTIRKGIEMDLRVKALDNLFFWGNYTYVDAKFDGTSNYVPLVPRHKATVGLTWEVIQNLSFSIAATHVGSRFMGGDVDNVTYNKLDSYEVVDTKLSYKWKEWELFAGVNNLFNEKYTSVAFGDAWSGMGLYPMPGINAFIGLEWRGWFFNSKK